MFTDLLFYAYHGIHQVKKLVFENYQMCPLPLNKEIKHLDSSAKFSCLSSSRKFRFIQSRQLERDTLYNRFIWRAYRFHTNQACKLIQAQP